MSFGLNGAFMANTLNFLQNHAVTTALLGAVHPPLGVSTYDFMRSQNFPVDQGCVLLPTVAVGLGDALIQAYWLPQGGYIQVPAVAPGASVIFTPELSGCKIYVDKVFAQRVYRIFHIQCPHEAAEYAVNVRGARLATIDSRDYGGVPSVDGPATVGRILHTRCTVLLRRAPGGAWSIYLQGLTGIGPGIGGGGLVYPPGPAQQVGGVLVKPVPPI